MITAAVAALVNVAVLAALPCLGYFAYHKLRHRRPWGEIAKRAGLQVGERRYLGYGLVIAAVCVIAVVLWPPSIETSTREGSAFRPFDGLGLGATSIVMALIYGVVKTGFAEELLFRGLIAGSLSRRMGLPWANLLQAAIFLVPHALLLLIMPEAWRLMPLIFAGALLAGWLRIRSGSILAPWLIHASVNVAVGLTVAMRTVG